VSTTKVSKAILPVAGLGTRFLPATKANPKEMLPIVDKPLIQYAVEEAIAAGITELIFVTSHSKRAIEDHFDSNQVLETALETQGRLDLLSLVRDIIPPGVTCIYIRQNEQLGLGHAILCAEKVVGNEPCAILLADELISGADGSGCFSQLVDLYQQTNSHVLAVQHVPDEETQNYGIVGIADAAADLKQITSMIEKPARGKAPSNYAAIGRYILLPTIFEQLKAISAGAGGELQLSDAIARLLEQEKVYAHELQGERYDCGSKLGYLQATVQYALRHPELGEPFAKYLQGLMLETTLE